MGFFSSKPSVTDREFHREVMPALRRLKFTEREQEDIRQIFSGDLDEPQPSERGIDKHELEARIKWMQNNTTRHGVPGHKLEALKQEMLKKM